LLEFTYTVIVLKLLILIKIWKFGFISIFGGITIFEDIFTFLIYFFLINLVFNTVIDCLAARFFIPFEYVENAEQSGHILLVLSHCLIFYYSKV